MIRIIVLLLVALLSIGASQIQAASPVTYPCSVVLHPVKMVSNIQGVALVTKVKKPYTNKPASPLRERQSGIG